MIAVLHRNRGYRELCDLQSKGRTRVTRFNCGKERDAGRDYVRKRKVHGHQRAPVDPCMRHEEYEKRWERVRVRQMTMKRKTAKKKFFLNKAKE